MGDQLFTAREALEAGPADREENAEDVLSWLLEILTNLLAHLQQEWTRQKHLTHRSFVRRVCDLLPSFNSKRIHLQTNLLGSARLTSTRFVSLESSLDDVSVSSFSMDDGIWVEEDKNRQVIRAGRTKYADFNTTADTTPALWDPTADFADGDTDSHTVHHSTANPVHPAERSSTPLDFLSGFGDSSQQVDPDTLQKISMMEEELATLRKQIADLVMLQDTSKAAGEGSREEPGAHNMAAVLKDLGKVKLKPVNRSPGGTPMQSRPRLVGSDPASIIAEALKKKFRNRVQYSPDPADKENENPDFDSPERSPQVKFGQHMLRRTRKRLSLIEEGETGPFSPSPLKESNQ
ncbi:hypothetical protein ACOMHN_043906 [Nucella lapillus]